MAKDLSSSHAGVETLTNPEDLPGYRKFFPRGCGDTGTPMITINKKNVLPTRVWRHCSPETILASLVSSSHAGVETLLTGD